MKSSCLIALVAIGLFAGSTVYAQQPAAAPAGSTGQCKDGSYTSNATKRGACRGHKGVQTWYAAAGATTAKSTRSTKHAKSASAPAAATAAVAPAGATGQCKDGSYTTNATKRGACRGHKGVKSWSGSTAAAANPAAAAAPAAVAAPASNSAMSSHRMAPTPPANAAAGGGAGMVWVNDSSKIYHCQGDKWYGKTKHGEYMSEADAKAKGDRPEHGKACTP